jgi:diguanylate cyclase (GGDEF)-like protein
MRLRSEVMRRRLSNRFRRVSLVLALGALLLGALASILGSAAVTREQNDRERRRLESDAKDVVTELTSSIVHASDLLSDSAAVVLGEPTEGSTRLQAWLDEANVAARYPELATLSVVDYTVEPDGTHSCRPRPGGYVASGAVAIAPGVDLCDGPMATSLAESIDNGGGVYIPETNREAGELLLLQSLLPGADAKLQTPEARRAVHAGWIMVGLQPELIVRRVAASRAHTSIAITHESPSGATVARAGTAPEPFRTVHHELGGDWTVDVSRTTHPARMVSASPAGAVLFGGLGGSFLVALLIALGGSLANVAARLTMRTRELHEQATHDSLTGLANRNEIQATLRHRLVPGAPTGCPTGVLHIDVDDFKAVNDSLGHHAGDDLLRAAAARLSSCMRESDVIARIGGDEFIVVLGGPVDDDTAHTIATRLLEVMRAPFHLPGARGPVRASVTIGAAVADGCTAEQALQDANLALHQAKAAGKNGIHVFHPQLGELQKQRYELQLDMTTALASEQFRLVYQPIWMSESQRCIAVEALLRWDHPTLGTIAPDRFIPELEANGHIVEVGRWVLREACREVARWQAIAPGLGVSVNASARQFADDQIIRDVREALAESGLAADLLTIEITETALMADPSISAGRLQALRDLGCHVAIDDFGVGYSSLGYLQTFPADVLKIDRSFVNGLSRAPESLALVRAIVQLAGDLHLETLAEGVETEDQLAVLRDHHVHYAQGFLVSRPLSPDELVRTMLEPQRQSAAPTSSSPVMS